MFYSMELLLFRKNRQKQPLQICWCAATTKNFIGTDSHKVSKQEINSVEIASICDDILSGFLGVHDMLRFNYYQTSQLMFGTLKIFQQHVNSLEEATNEIYSKPIFDSTPTARKNIKQSSKKSKVTEKENILDKELRLPSLPEIDIAKVFESLEFSEDTHLIREVDFPSDQMGVDLTFGFNSEGSTITNKDVDIAEHDMVFDIPENQVLKSKAEQIISQLHSLHHETAIQSEVAQTPFSPSAQRSRPTANKFATMSPLAMHQSSTATVIPMSPLAMHRSPPALTALDNEDSMLLGTEAALEAALPDFSEPAEPAPVENLILPQLPIIAEPELPQPSASTADDIEYPDPNDNLQSIPQSAEIPLASVKKCIEKIRRKRRIFADEITAMPLKVIPKSNIFTRKLGYSLKIDIKRESAQLLLTRPATSKMADCLLELFQRNIQTPFPHSVEEPDVFETRMEVEIEREVDERNDERDLYSTLIEKEAQIILSRVDENIPQDRLEDDAANTMMPIDPIDEPQYQDFVNNAETAEPSPKRFKATPATKQPIESIASELDFFTNVKSFWVQSKNKQEKLAFDVVVSPDKYTAKEAVKCLMYCFNLERDNKLYVEQENPDAPVYLGIL